MKTEDIKNRITEVLAAADGPLTSAEITTGLKLKGKERKLLQKCLHQLIAEGKLVRTQNKRYAIGAPSQMLSGQINIGRSGNGFLSTPDAEVMVPEECLGTALPGDKVLVKIDARRTRRGDNTKPTGSVVRILERTDHEIVGTLKATGRLLHVLPIDPSYRRQFHVVDAANARNNDKVVVRLISWKHAGSDPEAEIIETLGPDRPSIDTLAIIRHYQFKDTFPDEVVREAESASSLLSCPGKRTDLRDKFIITIDPATARDFDDALSLERNHEGNRILGVHIADVSHFVRQNGSMDKEALTRGNSVYFPDKVIPMLPEQLSNGICSLRPNEDRLTFTVFLTFDSSARVIKRSFARTIIKSRCRLTYEQAMASLESSRKKGEPVAGVNPRTAGLLKDLGKLARQLRTQRFARHALDLDMPDCEIEMAEDGMMTGIRIVPNDLSHQLVEECMIAANEAVAAELSNNGIPYISRLHKPPSEEKLRQLAAQLQELGLNPGDLNHRRNLASFLKSVADLPIAYHVRILVLKSMKRALYSHLSEGHFGLAKRFYAHFTSPIRRYPDLVVHRQLAAMLERFAAGSGVAPPYNKDRVSTIAAACSLTEQAADEAEMALLEIKKYRFLAQQLERRQPSEYDAVVVNVMNFGMFVELRQLQVQGLVHVSAISDRYVRFSQKNRTLKAGKSAYAVGDHVRVLPVRVDFEKRRIDFNLA